MMHAVRSAAAVIALLAMSLSLIPSGAFAADKATWVLILSGRVQPGDDLSSVFTTLGAPYDTMPYQYAFDCQVAPGKTPLKSFPAPNAVASGSATSPLMTSFHYVYVPITLPASMKPDNYNFVYVCRGRLLLNGVDVAVHDGSDITSGTIVQEVNELAHTVWWNIDRSKVRSEDCVSYDPAHLTTVHNGTIWQLVDGSHALNAFTSETDVLLALGVAKNYHMHCYIGRENTGPDRARYIMEYFK